MGKIRFEAPLTLFLTAGCILATYLPLADSLAIGGSLASLLHPWTWVRLLLWPFVHETTSHLLGNLMLFLILSPQIELRQGWLRYLAYLGFCSVVIGLGHLTFGAPGSFLVGASGWVFMLILLSTFVTNAQGTIPLHTLLVAGLYGWQELRAALTPNQVSHFAHFLGGICGLLFGYLGRGRSLGRATKSSS